MITTKPYGVTHIGCHDLRAGEWPEAADVYGTPKEKMPDCPACGLDELGMLTPDCILCYNCGFEAMRFPDRKRRPPRKDDDGRG